ncbi:MAG TPA: hypothetical protein DCX89_02940 [Saprospirales bacterium]|nr:hypothetical protein [Saprospirales bacterium]
MLKSPDDSEIPDHYSFINTIKAYKSRIGCTKLSKKNSNSLIQTFRGYFLLRFPMTKKTIKS